MKVPVLHVVLVSTLVFLTLGGRASAIDPPHDGSNGYSCGNCHAVHMTLGSTGYTNACLTCHRPGVPVAERKPFTLSDMANPFRSFTAQIGGARYQTSHSWSAPHGNPAAGAADPSSGSDLLSTKTVTGLACARCHDIHTYKDKPFLRAKNDQDQMCLDCHRQRNTTDHSLGTHPVNFSYNGTGSLVKVKPAEFHNPPLNANPANPTSALNFKNGIMVCTTCHGVHYADSNSATFDNSTAYYRLMPSSGTLLRTDLRGANGNSLNICSNCHVKMNHNYRGQNIQCADCHGGHVDMGDGSVSNVFLVKRYMNISSAGGRVLNRKVMFQYTSAGMRNYKDPAGTGVCQACHVVPEGVTFPAAHRLETASASACSICHPHNSSKGAFAAAGGSCAACHGHDQASSSPISSGKHSAHMNTALNPALGTPFGCVECHATSVSDNNMIIAASRHANGMADYSGARARGGANYNLSTHACSALYCHSDGKGTTKDMNGSAWNSMTTLDCKGCHGSDPMPAFAPQFGEPNYASSGAGTSRANSHYKHTRSGAASCEACHVQTTATGSAILSGSDKHVNVSIDVSFNTAKAGAGAGWTAGTKTCSNISCHFGGSAQWGGTLDCRSCHGSDPAPAFTSLAGEPNYANGGAGALRANSHEKHTRNGAISCDACHTQTTTTGTAINAGSLLHANNVNNVTFNTAKAGAGATWTASMKTCANISCHGNNQATWGGSLYCQDCHGGTTDADDFSGLFWENGTISKIRMSGGWDVSGHGRPSGSYDSGSSSANFTGIPNSCEFCHDSAVAHKVGGNIFRLRNYSTPQWGRNAVCQACHADGSTGVTISGLVRNGGKKVTSRHFGPKHGVPNSGGQFCWDCHDPHGDDNSYMVQNQVAKKSDAGTGAPTETASTVFVLDAPPNLKWADFVKTPDNNGICQVCHDQAKVVHFNAATYDAGHNAGGTCTACHPHNGSDANAAFAPKGDCDICHGYPPVRRGLALGTFGFSGNYSSARYQDYSGGGGAHTVMVHVKSTARASEGWANCAICHSNGSMSPSTHKMQMPVKPSTITIDVGDRFKFDYTRSLGTERYTGKMTDNHDNESGSCSNVSCHFKKAKKWSNEK